MMSNLFFIGGGDDEDNGGTDYQECDAKATKDTMDKKQG